MSSSKSVPFARSLVARARYSFRSASRALAEEDGGVEGSVTADAEGIELSLGVGTPSTSNASWSALGSLCMEIPFSVADRCRVNIADHWLRSWGFPRRRAAYSQINASESRRCNFCVLFFAVFLLVLRGFVQVSIAVVSRINPAGHTSRCSHATFQLDTSAPSQQASPTRSDRAQARPSLQGSSSRLGHRRALP